MTTQGGARTTRSKAAPTWHEAKSDVGAALIAVILFGAGLAILASAGMARGLAQFGNTSGHACWEASLANAEAALNWGVARVDDDPEYHTGMAPWIEALVGSSEERAAVIAAADEVGGSSVLSLPDGEAVFLRAEGSGSLYGVGYCGTRDAPDRRARVVRSTLSTLGGEEGHWEATYAFLTGGDVTISGNPTFGDPEFLGADSSVHANGSATVSGNVKFLDGCVTASAGGSLSGNVNISGLCPPPDERFAQPPVYIPPVVARDAWFKSEYDMCPDGVVRAGPAHPTLGATAQSEPCTGMFVADASSSPFRGWSLNSCCNASDWARWGTSGNTKYDGSYYFYLGTPTVSGNFGSSSDPWRAILIAEAGGSCPENVAGDIKISGNVRVVPYTAPGVNESNTLLVLAGRDFRWSGNVGMMSGGLVMAHEQFRMSGNVTAAGSFLAEDACDTPGSDVGASSVSGNTKFHLDGPKTVDWASGSGSGDEILVIVGWVEVR